MRYEECSIKTLFLHRKKIFNELKNRGVVRTKNITGDYAEYLVAKSLDLNLKKSSNKAIDATDSLGKTYQIKARQISETTKTPTIKSLRSFDFDFLILVLFDPDYSVKFCGQLTSKLAKELSTPNPRVNGNRITFTRRLISNLEIKKIIIDDV